MWRPITAIIARELIRIVRQKGRLLSAMVRPLIWLFIIGSGFEALLRGSGPGNYKQFMIPGLICMVLLFGAMIASLSLVYDKEAGVMRMLIVAPFPRYWIILARTLSAAIAGLLQAALLSLVLLILGRWYLPEHLGLFALGTVLTAGVCAALGMIIAVFSKTMDNFAVIMNFVIFPTFFLSGALYPLEHLPPALKTMALLNPFTYGVDLLKHAMLGDRFASFSPDLSVGIDIAVQAGFIVLSSLIACLRFNQTPVLEGLARILSAPRRG